MPPAFRYRSEISSYGLSGKSPQMTFHDFPYAPATPKVFSHEDAFQRHKYSHQRSLQHVAKGPALGYNQSCWGADSALRRQFFPPFGAGEEAGLARPFSCVNAGVAPPLLGRQKPLLAATDGLPIALHPQKSRGCGVRRRGPSIITLDGGDNFASRESSVPRCFQDRHNHVAGGRQRHVSGLVVRIDSVLYDRACRSGTVFHRRQLLQQAAEHDTEIEAV